MKSRAMLLSIAEHATHDASNTKDFHGALLEDSSPNTIRSQPVHRSKPSASNRPNIEPQCQPGKAMMRSCKKLCAPNPVNRMAVRRKSSGAPAGAFTDFAADGLDGDFVIVLIVL